MKILSAEFITSAVNKNGYPELNLPELAFIGRSNVGKSSLINNLTQRRKLAKTSSVPGKTQTINFYTVNQNIALVDLPGYGFTRVPEKISAQWRFFMNEYFQSRQELKAVIQLIDCRHTPTAMDIRVCKWLSDTDLLGGICVVKADKLKKNKLLTSIKVIKNTLNIDETVPLLVHSSKTSKGRDHVWDIILQLLDLDDEA